MELYNTKKRRTCEINIRIDLITTGSYFVAVDAIP
jgi:hypothetical protein